MHLHPKKTPDLTRLQISLFKLILRKLSKFLDMIGWGKKNYFYNYLYTTAI